MEMVKAVLDSHQMYSVFPVCSYPLLAIPVFVAPFIVFVFLGEKNYYFKLFQLLSRIDN